MGKNFDGLLSEIADVLNDAHALQTEHHFPSDYWTRVDQIASVSRVSRVQILYGVVCPRPIFELLAFSRISASCSTEEDCDHFDCVFDGRRFGAMYFLKRCSICERDLPLAEGKEMLYTYYGRPIVGTEFIDHLGICESCLSDLRVEVQP